MKAYSLCFCPSMALDFVCVSDFRVKKEPDWDDASDTVAIGSLYAGHKVKEEMVLGPEVLQPADVAFLLKNQGRYSTF